MTGCVGFSQTGQSGGIAVIVRLLLFISISALSFGGVAQAQFVCGGSAAGAEPQTGGGATATGTNAVACGTGSSASDFGTTALGQATVASGAFSTATGSTSTATGVAALSSGFHARATGDYTVATGTESQAIGTGAIAVGNGTQAVGTGGIAIGQSTSAGGNQSTAIGITSSASGASSVAFGASSQASASNASAFGASANASFANSTAIGQGATTSRANQVMVGTAANTYTLAGVASAASRAAQTGAVSVLTTDANGNLATASFNPQDVSLLQSSVGTLQTQMRQAFEGTAIAIALGGAALPQDKKFAISTNWGNFRGQNALGVAAQMRLSDYAVASVGVGGGFAEGGIGSRAGVTFAW